MADLTIVNSARVNGHSQSWRPATISHANHFAAQRHCKVVKVAWISQEVRPWLYFVLILFALAGYHVIVASPAKCTCVLAPTGSHMIVHIWLTSLALTLTRLLMIVSHQSLYKVDF